MVSNSNPNKVNQYTEPDPRQSLFLSYYLDPKSETFSNAYQSALKAGYEKEYAENLTSSMPKWLSESLGDLKMVERAERNLKQVQELVVVDEKGKVATDVLRERNKVDMFIAERLNKKKYSQRQELADPNGNPITLQTINVVPINDGQNT
jgi:hypothetical protein